MKINRNLLKKHKGTHKYIFILFIFIFSITILYFTQGRCKKNSFGYARKRGGSKHCPQLNRWVFFLKKEKIQCVLKRKNMYLGEFQVILNFSPIIFVLFFHIMLVFVFHRFQSLLSQSFCFFSSYNPLNSVILRFLKIKKKYS